LAGAVRHSHGAALRDRRDDARRRGRRRDPRRRAGGRNGRGRCGRRRRRGPAPALRRRGRVRGGAGVPGGRLRRDHGEHRRRAVVPGVPAVQRPGRAGGRAARAHPLDAPAARLPAGAARGRLGDPGPRRAAGGAQGRVGRRRGRRPADRGGRRARARPPAALAAGAASRRWRRRLGLARGMGLARETLRSRGARGLTAVAVSDNLSRCKRLKPFTRRPSGRMIVKRGMPLRTERVRQLTALLPILAVALLAACSGDYPQTTFRPVTEFGAAINDLFTGVFWWTMLVLVAVWTVLIYVV